MAEGGGGASTNEVLDDVRELLRGQRRLEQLVAGLARSLGAPGAGGDGGVALARAAGEGVPLPEGELALADSEGELVGEEEPEARQSSRQGSEGPTELQTAASGRVLAALRESGCSSSGSAAWPVETQLWLERVEIRERLADCGSKEDLAKECHREAAIARSRTHKLSDSDRPSSKDDDDRGENDDGPLRRQKSLGRGRASRSTWLSRLSKSMMLCPASGARPWFDLLSVCVLAYNLSSIPYFVAFQVDHGGNPWYSFECMSAAFWSLDILLSFRTGYYADGHLVMNPRKAARRYLMGTFFVDITTVTVDIMSLIMHTSDLHVSEFESAKFIRLLKVVRITRLSAAGMRMRNLNVILGRFGHTSHANAVKMFGSLFNLCKFLVVLLWINHAIACMWLYLGREYSQDAAPDTGYTWMDLRSGGLPGTYSDYGHAYQYITAFHWALTQMTPGSMQVFPVNSIERLFNIFVLIGGFLFFSVVVSAISTSMAQLRIDAQRNTQKMEGLTRFLIASQIQPTLRMQVCKQVKMKLMQVRPQAVKDVEELDMISLSLRHALQLALCNPHFLEHPLLHFLSDHDAAMWEETCMACAHFSVLVRGDNLFVFGGEAEGMYFVVRGALSYDLNDSFSEESQELSTEAAPGAWLSEAALWCRWRHMGCAEAQGEACCEVLLLKAESLMPILTRRGLTGQMAWAYAHSFHYFLHNSKPPLCNWPNDLVLPFGSDEVIAAMIKDAAVMMGQGAIEVLKARPGTLASWALSVREDKIEKLASEIRDGGSTLLVTSKQGVVRCVPLVVLRLCRQDGRVLVRMRLASKSDGSQEATCKLPGGKQKAGEHPDMCLQRLLEGKLSVLADSIEVVGVERQRERDNSRTFGVPTRYVRTVVSAAWPEHAATVLGQFLVPGVQPTQTMGFGTWGSKERGDPVEVFMLPGDTDFHAWLTEEQLVFFNTSQGQPRLSLWLSELCRRVERPTAFEAEPGRVPGA